MFKKLMLVLLFASSLAACSLLAPYGKKVTINKSLEIYIKGDSTTEADAKKMGNYLAELWKDLDNQKSFQLVKENGGYTVRMVIDEEKLKTDGPALDVSFAALRMVLENEVFKGSKVKLIVTNNTFKDLKTYDDTTTLEPSKEEATKSEDTLSTK